ncbi:MAG: hypothetical protein IPJ60_01605 [Sphingobacteriaceae bacterium]|nr:hypothetical protein [Sphingobacteriaceae bacterium]
MIFDKLIPKQFLVKQEVCAVEALFDEAGITYHITLLKNKGKNLELIYKQTTKDKLDLPKKIIKSKLPVVVIINGKGVVTKKIGLSNEAHQSIDNLIEQNLPTVNKNELNIQVFRQSDHTAFLSLCRKEQVDSVVSDLKVQKVDVANVLIGAPAILGLQPLWSSFNCLPTSLHSVELNNGAIESIQSLKPNEDKLKLEGIEFEKENSLGFAAGLSYLMQNKINENSNAAIDDLELKHSEKNKFKVLTLFCVAIAFIIAITNVVFYTSYFEENSKLETELSVYQGKNDEINKLLSDYKSKKDLIEGAGVLNRNKLSEYADKIGATIPEEVVLSQLYFNPKNENDESDDSLTTFENKHLVIKGNCNKKPDS